MEVSGSCGPYAEPRLADLLIGFVGWSTVRSHRAAANLACWVGTAVEMSTMVVEGDTNPLAIPTLAGPRARRNLGPALKAAIASEAATGKVVRSCSKVVGALGRFAGRLSPLARGNAHKLRVEVPKAYLSNAIAHYRGTNWQFWSLAADGARLGGQEVLMTGLLTPESGKVLWTAPYARTLARPVRRGGGGAEHAGTRRKAAGKRRFLKQKTPRRKPPETAGTRRKPPEHAGKAPPGGRRNTPERAGNAEI